MAIRDGTGDSGASVQALPWQVHAASVIGAGHVKEGRPNEDAVAHQLAQSPGGPALLVVAVADGHGDARHFRSDRGAQMAVAAGISAMADWSARISRSPAEIKLSARHDLVPDVVARWNAAVTADLSEDQFTAAEHAVLTSRALPPPTAYGSTLLIGAFTSDYAVFAQIGDGNIVAVRPDGRPGSPVPADKRLDGSRTTSLCQAGAEAAFRIGVVQLAARPLFAALLATDGFGNAQAEDPWQPSLAADLAELGLEHDQDWFASRVPDWAAQCASSAGSGDDATIALVINSAVRPSRRSPHAGPYPHPAAVTVPVEPLQVPVPSRPRAADEDHRPRAENQRPDAPSRQPRNRVWAWTAVAIAVILAGLVLALLLPGHGRPSGRPAPSQRPSHAATHRPSPSPSASVSLPRAGTGRSTPASARAAPTTPSATATQRNR